VQGAEAPGLKVVGGNSLHRLGVAKRQVTHQSNAGNSARGERRLSNERRQGVAEVNGFEHLHHPPIERDGVVFRAPTVGACPKNECATAKWALRSAGHLSLFRSETNVAPRRFFTSWGVIAPEKGKSAFATAFDSGDDLFHAIVLHARRASLCGAYKPSKKRHPAPP